MLCLVGLRRDGLGVGADALAHVLLVSGLLATEAVRALFEHTCTVEGDANR